MPLTARLVPRALAMGPMGCGFRIWSLRPGLVNSSCQQVLSVATKDLEPGVWSWGFGVQGVRRNDIRTRAPGPGAWSCPGALSAVPPACPLSWSLGHAGWAGDGLISTRMYTNQVGSAGGAFASHGAQIISGCQLITRYPVWWSVDVPAIGCRCYFHMSH